MPPITRATERTSPIRKLASGAALLMLLAMQPALAQVITTVAGNGGNVSSGNGGPAVSAAVPYPTAVATIPGGGFYVATDLDIRRVDAAGIITHVAGSPTTSGNTGDGGPAANARFSGIESMALDPAGNLHILDAGNSRVRRIDGSGIITTVAGNGVNLFSAVPGPATERPLRFPHAIAFGADGVLYIADHSSLRKVSTGGEMTVIAGDGTVGFAGDGGPAASAKLSGPTGLAVAGNGTIYIADSGNVRVRKIAANGTITSLPTNEKPNGLALSPDGKSLYFAVTAENVIATIFNEVLNARIAGTGEAGFSGDGGGAGAARLNGPAGVATDVAGLVYVADSGNLRVRRIDMAGVDPRPVFHVDSEIRVLEGNSGMTNVVINWTLTPAATGPVTFTLSTQDGGAGSFTPANAGVDYVARPATQVTIPAGTTSGTVTVQGIGDQNIEPDEAFDVMFRSITGAQTAPGSDSLSTSIVLLTDDTAPAEPFIVRHDQFHLWVDAKDRVLYPTSNDNFDHAAMVGGSLTIVQAPAHGSATVVPGTSSPANAVNDSVVYSPAAGFAGTDRFRYRLCSQAGVCGEAWVDLFIRLGQPLDLQTVTRSGNEEAGVGTVSARQGMTYSTTPLVAPTRYDLALTADLTPATPWDSDAGTAFRLVTLPPVSGAAIVHRIIADIYSYDFLAVDVYVGIDSNGNGRPDASEIACSAGKTGNASCEFDATQGATGVAYWVMAHSRTGDLEDAQIDVFDVALIASNDTLVATGAGNVLADGSYDLLLAWRDDSLVVDETRMGYVRTTAAGGVSAGDLRVRIHRGSEHVEEPIQIAPGKPLSLRLSAGASHDRIYFDLPANATRLVVGSQSSSEIDFRVVRMNAPLDATRFEIASAPGQGAASYDAVAPGGTQSLTIPGALAAGRWYVVPKNNSSHVANLTLTVTVEALAPVVRSGSYFNSSRPGSGLFIYPAADQLTAIWYTYDTAQRATWYYLQGLAPGADGIWRGGIYRGTWHGTSGYLTHVGDAMITATGPDLFTLGYSIDGVAGSQPMSALGRGCPVQSGQNVDTSSQWFDPAHSGTGYSTQMWPTYEMHAAFVYDMRGQPLFLLAENGGFGGPSATLTAEKISGACPTCQFFSSTRQSVGTLRRTIAAGKLARFEVDVLYTDPSHPTTSFWTSNDTVQLLGGPGTTQGCAP